MFVALFSTLRHSQKFVTNQLQNPPDIWSFVCYLKREQVTKNPLPPAEIFERSFQFSRDLHENDPQDAVTSAPAYSPPKINTKTQIILLQNYSKSCCISITKVQLFYLYYKSFF